MQIDFDPDEPQEIQKLFEINTTSNVNDTKNSTDHVEFSAFKQSKTYSFDQVEAAPVSGNYYIIIVPLKFFVRMRSLFL